MPFYTKMDLYRITEYRNGCVYKTKKVGYHWFRSGQSPEPNSRVPNDLVKQNSLPDGEYVYCSTLDYVIDSRCPSGGTY